MHYWLEFVLCYWVLNFMILNLPVNLSLVENSIVLESKSNSIGYSGCIVFVNNFQKKCLIVKRITSFLRELSECDEIVRVYSVECLELRNEGTHIHDESSHLYLSSEARLTIIKRKQSNEGILVSPETAQSALHVSSCQLNLNGVLAVLTEAEDIPHTLAWSDLVEGLELAFQEESH